MDTLHDASLCARSKLHCVVSEATTYDPEVSGARAHALVASLAMRRALTRRGRAFAQVAQLAHVRGLPFLTLDWIIQSLVAQTSLDFDVYASRYLHDPPSLLPAPAPALQRQRSGPLDGAAAALPVTSPSQSDSPTMLWLRRATPGRVGLDCCYLSCAHVTATQPLPPFHRRYDVGDNVYVELAPILSVRVPQPATAGRKRRRPVPQSAPGHKLLCRIDMLVQPDSGARADCGGELAVCRLYGPASAMDDQCAEPVARAWKRARRTTAADGASDGRVLHWAQEDAAACERLHMPSTCRGGVVLLTDVRMRVPVTCLGSKFLVLPAERALCGDYGWDSDLFFSL